MDHNKERLQILRCPFTDPVAHTLCRKLVRIPQKRWFEQQKLRPQAGSLEFQEVLYKKILAFYHSGNIMQSVMEFINTPDGNGHEANLCYSIDIIRQAITNKHDGA